MAVGETRIVPMEATAAKQIRRSGRLQALAPAFAEAIGRIETIGPPCNFLATIARRGCDSRTKKLIPAQPRLGERLRLRGWIWPLRAARPGARIPPAAKFCEHCRGVLPSRAGQNSFCGLGCRYLVRSCWTLLAAPNATARNACASTRCSTVYKRLIRGGNLEMRGILAKKYLHKLLAGN